MQILNNKLLDKITEQAKQSQRLRMNYNLHTSLDAKAQRLFNALEPNTEIPIHRHNQSDETYLLVRGAMRIIFFNHAKEIIATEVLKHGTDNFGIHIPAGQWHTLEVLETGTVIFEVKDGPYAPLAPDEVMT